MRQGHLPSESDLRFSARPAVVLLPQPETVPTGIAIVRALGRQGVTVIAVGGAGPCPSFASRYAARCLRSPAHGAEGGEWLEWMLTLGRQVKPRPVVFASADEQVALMCANREALAPLFDFYYMDDAALRACNDKAVTTHVATQAGLPYPRTLIFDGTVAPAEVAAQAPAPCVLKPNTWVGVEDGQVVRTDRFSRCFGNKAVRAKTRDEVGCYLRQAAREDLTVLVQEEVVGPGSQLFSVGVYADERSRLRGVFVGRKLRQYPCDFGSACLCAAACHEGIVEAAHELMGAVGYFGIAEIEYKLDEAGNGWLLEINPRPWVWFSMSEIAGVNLAACMYHDLTRQPLPNAVQRETRVRWLDRWRDLEYYFQYRRGDHLGQRMSLQEYLRSISGPKEYAYGTIDDPGPGRVQTLVQTRRIPGRAWRKTARTLRLARGAQSKAPCREASSDG